MRAVSKQRLRSLIGPASAAELEAVEAALKHILELP
jgi:mRNA-degrading endonuclease toxin of MazEF toxin-antitoxin module